MRHLQRYHHPQLCKKRLPPNPNPTPKCPRCGVENTFPELQHCPIYQEGYSSKLYDCKKWAKVSITNSKNKQDEMIDIKATLHELMDHFRDALKAARSHYVDTK